MHKIQELVDAEDALVKAHARIRYLYDEKELLKAKLKALDNKIAVELEPEKEALKKAEVKQDHSLSAWQLNPFACHRYMLSVSKLIPIRAAMWWNTIANPSIWYLDFLDLTKKQWKTVVIHEANEEPITHNQALLKADKVLLEAGYNLTTIPPF